MREKLRSQRETVYDRYENGNFDNMSNEPVTEEDNAQDSI